MKKIIYFLCSLFIATTSAPILALSPWVVIDNRTKFDFACEIEVMYYDFNSDTSGLFFNTEEELHVTCDDGQDEDGNEYMKFTLNFYCPAERSIVFNPIFYEDDKPYNPEITSVAFTHESLQLKAFCDSKPEDHRYFSINYHAENGIHTNTQEISIYVKCLNSVKQTLRSIVLTALNVINRMPY